MCAFYNLEWSNLPYIRIDLTTDENKYVTRFISRLWKQGLPERWRLFIEKLIGEKTQGLVLIRRKTPDELVDFCIKELQRGFPEKHYQQDDKILRSKLHRAIVVGHNNIFTIEDEVLIDFIMHW